jgi:leader peptidase (prepilin peptidase)/N-methyltransferase
MKVVLIKTLIAVLYGVILGIATIPLSRKLAVSRTEDPADVALLNKLPIKLLAVVLGVGASVAVMLTAESTALIVRNLLLLLPIFSISYVDALVRKIPNPLLLIMLIIQGVYIAYTCISEKDTSLIPTAFIGFFVGMVVCTIPSILKIPMGAGDVKYSGVIGLTIYAMGYFQSMVVMAVLVALYFVYLKIKHKGGMKTQIPMGPFLSIGVVISMCFSIFDFVL